MLAEGRPRETWQLEQWEDAIKWYLIRTGPTGPHPFGASLRSVQNAYKPSAFFDWLAACAEEGGDHRSLPERVRSAVNSACARRGLARRTKQCYGAWAARYATFAGDEREAMRVETATRFLTSVVEDEDCAYATQKQALNALAFF